VELLFKRRVQPMTNAINSAVEKAAQKLYEARVEQATAEYFECLEKEKDELGDELGIDTTFSILHRPVD
jgi:hypothetical protein